MLFIISGKTNNREHERLIIGDWHIVTCLTFRDHSKSGKVCTAVVYEQLQHSGSTSEGWSTILGVVRFSASFRLGPILAHRDRCKFPQIAFGLVVATRPSARDHDVLQRHPCRPSALLAPCGHR